jgi:porphobilinogen synthase
MGINIDKKDLIYPYFVTAGSGKKEPIPSFPDQYRFSPELLADDVGQLLSLGVDKVLLFGVPEDKDALGSAAYKDNNVVGAAIKLLKKKFPRLAIFTDVCLCAYTDHGHCGIIPGIDKIDRKRTLATLEKMALAHARAGADYVAPSAMVRGQVAAIRKALDRDGYGKTKIMGYSAKFASGFYGPFRNAANSAPKFGDRKRYQLDYSDAASALDRISADIDEGADMIMVKPALAYLDIIYRAKKKFKVPLAAYNTSGEYALLHGQKDMIIEALTGVKRAGADLIITYHAKELLRGG